MDGWIDTDVYMYVCMYGWMDDSWMMDGWIEDGWMDRYGWVYVCMDGWMMDDTRHF